MPNHYQQEDKERLAPAMKAVRDAMQDQGWYDLDLISKRTGVRVGTVASKLRELCDSRHRFLGLSYERRRLKGGVHEYRLFSAEPEQLTLLAEVAA